MNRDFIALSSVEKLTAAQSVQVCNYEIVRRSRFADAVVL